MASPSAKPVIGGGREEALISSHFPMKTGVADEVKTVLLGGDLDN